MAKRFTATEKWNDPWFCELKTDDKLFWIYLIDNCNHAGIWQVNWPLVRFHIRDYKYNAEVFKDRIVELSKEKWFIQKFIVFQYGELNPENRAHLSVIKLLEKEGAYKGHNRGLQAPMDMDMDKDMDKDKDKDKDKELVFKNEEVEKAWLKWVRYKKEQHGFKYKSVESEQEGINKLIELCDGDYKNAILIVNESISQGWKGLFALKKTNKNKNLTIAEEGKELADRLRKRKGWDVIDTEVINDSK